MQVNAVRPSRRERARLPWNGVDSATVMLRLAGRPWRELVERASVTAMDPRLAIQGERTVRIVRLEGEDLHLHPTAEGALHLDCGPNACAQARIRRVGERFFWQDEGSRGSVRIDNEPLPANLPVEIGFGSLIVVGRAQMVLLASADRKGRRHRPIDRFAAALLMESGSVRARHMRPLAAMADDEARDMGELLLQAGLVSVTDWHDLLRRARILADPAVATVLAEQTRRTRLTTLTAALLLAAVVVAAARVFGAF